MIMSWPALSQAFHLSPFCHKGSRAIIVNGDNPNGEGLPGSNVDAKRPRRA